MMASQNRGRKLRIAIEAQRLFRPQKHGMDVVALEMIRMLQQLDTYNEYYILTKEDSDVCLQETSNFHIVCSDSSCYPYWEQVYLPRWVATNKPDLLHCTSSTAPLWVGCPLFLTLHDLIFLEKSSWVGKNAGSAYQQFGNYYRRMVAPSAARRAKVVFTVSAYQKSRIESVLGIPEDRVRVAYGGASSQFLVEADERLQDEVRHAYGLPEKYILFLGNTDPRKNLSGVLKAYAMLLQRLGNNAPLLVITGISRKYLVEKMVEQSVAHIEGSVKLVDYVAASHLSVVYQHAEMLLFPSFSEGFGLPIVEAMASRIPVVTSNVTSMPEVAGDAALLVDPASPAGIADAAEALLKNAHLREMLVEKGYLRSQQFTWRSMSEQVLESYLGI